MVVVCKDYTGRCVLVTRRNEKRTAAIIVVDKTRTLKTFSNTDFDKRFKVLNYSPLEAIETWLSSTIEMTKTVREELKMVVAIFRNRKVAEADTVEGLGELKDKTTIVDGIESLEGKTMKDLVKLYNTNEAVADRVKVIPDVNGDINEAAEVVLNKLADLEVVVPAKKASKPRVEKTYSFIGNPAEDESLPKQARCILNTLDTEGPLTRTQLVAALDGVVETKQPVDKIVAFYQKRLVESGFMSMA